MAMQIVVLPTLVKLEQDGHQETLCVLRRPSHKKHTTLVILQEVYSKLLAPIKKVSSTTFSKACHHLNTTTSYYHEELEVPAVVLNQLKMLKAVPFNSRNKLKAGSPAYLCKLLQRCRVSKQSAQVLCNMISSSTSSTIQQLTMLPQPAQQHGLQQQATHIPAVGQHHAAAQQQSGPQQQLDFQQPVAGVGQHQAGAQLPNTSWGLGISMTLRQGAERSQYPRHSKFTYFPEQLPDLPSADRMGKLGFRYGLGQAIKQNSEASMLKQELAEFGEFLTSPLQFNRKAPHVQKATMEDYMDTLHVFMGVSHTLMDIHLHKLSLWDCASPQLLAMFFQVQLRHKEVGQNSIAMYASRLSQVLQYLELHTSHNSSEKSQLQQVMQWLGNLRGQVAGLAAEPSSLNLQMMPSVGEIVQLQEQYINKQVAGFEAYISKPSAYNSLQQQQVIWGLQDAALFACLYGFMAPPRLKALATAKHPCYEHTQCMDQDCKQQGCHGNSFIRGQDGNYSLRLVHHKVATTSTVNPQNAAGGRVRCHSSSTAAQPILTPLPAGLQKVLHLWVASGRGMQRDLCLSKQETEGSQQLLFIHPRSEQAFTSKDITPWFKQVLIAAGVPEDKVFTPRDGRHLWVSTMKVMEAEGQQLPNMRGQAHMMGHDPRQWDAPTYNKYQKQLEVKKAAAAMPALRHALLQQVQQQQQQQQVQQQQQQQHLPGNQSSSLQLQREARHRNHEVIYLDC